MEAVKILLLCVVSAVVYGILQDQVTARVCVEYFTIGHPPVFGTEDPTLLAFGWGILATWWVGVLLGLPMMLVARVGKRPRLRARDLVKPIAWLMLCVGLTALVAGLWGYWNGEGGPGGLAVHVLGRLPREKNAAFMADLCAHNAGYAAGFLGGIVLMLWAWRRRGQLARQAKKEPHQAE